MRVWKNEKKYEDAEIGGNYAFRLKRVENRPVPDPREDEAVNWFMWKSRSFREFESENNDLAALFDLVAQKERGAGIPPEKSCLEEYLPDGSENPDCLLEEDVRKGCAANLAKAAERLGIALLPVFVYDHGGCVFSTARNPMWGGWDTSYAGFIWSGDCEDTGKFEKMAESACRNFTDWWEGEVYDIERAPVNPETCEILGNWERIDPDCGQPLDEDECMEVMGLNQARKCLLFCAGEAAREADGTRSRKQSGPAA